MAGLNTAQIKSTASQKGISISDDQANSILKQAWDQSQYGADAGKVSSLLSGYASPSQTSSNTYTAPNIDPVAQAQKLNEFYKTANQPAIQSLQSTKDDLTSKYSDLVASIKGNQQTAENSATLNTSNEYGARGLLPTDSFVKNQIQGAVNPIRSQYSGQLANAGLAETQDMGNIALQIANLQSGNPSGAVSSALSQLGLQQGASQFAQTLPIQQQQGQYISIPGVGVYNISTGQIVNQLNGGASSNNGIVYIGGVPYVNK